MDYAAYQPSHTHPHAYAPPHNGTAGAPVTSPTQQNQVSPIMSQQTHAYSQQPDANTNSHQVMSQMGYSQGYPVTNMHHSYLSASHAAAMATAAASGNYNYSMPDQSMQALAQDPRQSPRMAGQAVKTETRQTPRSPPSQTHMGVTTSLPGQMVMSTAQSLPQSMISSPAVQSQQSGMSQRRPSMTPQMVQQQQQPQPQPQPAQQHSSPEAPAGNNEESPLYVNAKQFHRILKRRLQRQKLEETLRLTSKGRKPYLHESRHNHAMRRPRGPGGRFLTADEVAAMDAKEGGNGLVELPPSNGVKRKAGDMSGHKPPTPSKRGRMQLAAKTSSSPDDDEDEGDEEG